MTCLMLCANGLSVSLRLQKKIWIDLALERVSEVSINPKALNISVLDGLCGAKYSPEIFLSPETLLGGHWIDSHATLKTATFRTEPRAWHFKKEQRTKQRSTACHWKREGCSKGNLPMLVISRDVETQSCVSLFAK